jgi:acetoin:2,6-dichlorophenolindophenol oxidoreductase subunit alpha
MPNKALAEVRHNQRPELAAITDEQLEDAYYRMVLIRRFEEKAEECYTRGLIHGTMHLSIGQEASAIGCCMALERSDFITSTHRGHGHSIGKGADPKLMFAEFFGKETGYCRGRGGSMHIADVEAGNLGANGIVGGGLPIAVGAGLSIKLRKTSEVCVAFFGDGASNEGAFHESLNLASVWKLPVIFVCENNKYGMSMSSERSTSAPNVADRAVGYSMPGKTINGNDLPLVYATAKEAVDLARAGGGPSLIECKTYRIRGHSKSDRNLYRTKEEIEEWRGRDPIRNLRAEVTQLGRITNHRFAAIDARVEEEMAAAIEFAIQSPSPDPSRLTDDVYA